MTWVPILLAERSASLRYLVLRDLFELPKNDTELMELERLRTQDRILTELLDLQEDDGSFRTLDGSRDSWRGIWGTSQALLRFGYLGFDSNYPAVKQAAEFLFSQQELDGSWALPDEKSERDIRESYSMIPLQTGMPLRALAASGYAQDPRSETAYEWLIANRLADGAWPSGVKGGQHVFPGGYRRLAHSRFGCRTNTTFAVSALANHPKRKYSQPAKKGLDHLLAQEVLQSHALGYEVARTIGFERGGGYFTYFARHDPAMLLDLCGKIGASLEDSRVSDLVNFILALQGPYGLWEYPSRPIASRWISFDLLRSLSFIDESGDWVSLSPRTPFQAYPKVDKRY